MSKTGIIILAAGSSTRMGEPKQLMMYKNKTFLQHIIDEAKNANLESCYLCYRIPVRPHNE